MTGQEFETDVARRTRLLRRIVWTASFVGPVLLGLLGILLLQQVLTANKLNDAVTQSQETRALLASVLSAHQDLELGQRGYQITDRREFLEPYVLGSKEIDRIMPQLQRKYTRHPDQLLRLKRVAEISREKRRFANTVVTLHARGEHSAARDLVAKGRGKWLMDQLRTALGRMTRDEIRHLQEITDQSKTATTVRRSLTFGLLGLLVILLVAAAIAITRTLESRNRTLIELEDTSRRRAAILESAMDGIITLNPSGTIEGVNSAAIRMFGYSEPELLGRDVGMLFAETPTIGQVAEVLRDMHLREGTPGSLQEIVARRKDGVIFSTDVAVSVAPLAEGRRYVAVVRDVTERKRIARLQTEFVSTVSHELRTPLTSIAGSLGLLVGGAGGELSAKAHRLITIAHNNAERLIRLINDILDVEKLEAGKMRFDNRRLELAPALARAVDENLGFAQSHSITISLDRGHAAAFVHADGDRLAQVLSNLISNAVKYSPPGESVAVILVPGEHRHRITVQDHGPGIPEEFRTRIFDKFAQADSSDSRTRGGTGLGLSIVREIVTRLGGEVSFQSELGRGTEFHVDLPAVDPEEGAAPPPSEILLCGAGAAATLRDALDPHRYSLTVAETRQDALRLLDGKTFDAILVDMREPGDAPVEMIRHARRSACNEQTPLMAIGVVAEGGCASETTLVVDWLHKPVELDSLVEQVEAAVVRRVGDRPRVLHVDDDPDILRVVSSALLDKAQVTSAQSLAEARAAIETSRYDLALLDLTLRDGRGPELLRSLREASGDIPIVIFSAEDADSDNLSQFAAFLTKGRTPISQLVEIVDREIRRVGKRQ